MFGRLFLLVVAVVLSGCAGNNAQSPEVQQSGPGAGGTGADQPLVVEPEPVHIDESHDLTMGADGLSWSFKVGHAVRSGHVRISLQPLAETDGQRVVAYDTICYTYEVSNGSSKSSCPSRDAIPLPINLNVNAGGWMIIDEDPIEPGEHTFTFSSDRAPSKLVLDIVAEY